MRGRRLVAGAAVVGVVLLGTGIHAVWPTGRAVAGPTPPATTSAPSSRPSTKAAAATTSPTSGPAVTTSATASTTTKTTTTKTTRTMVHSGLAATNKFTTSTVAIPAARHTTVTHTFVVKVETSVKQDPNDVAAAIEKTLNDPRGWIGYHGASFAAVSDPAKAEFTIYLASPPTADRLCLPLNTQRTWNCETSKKVVLNSDRWFSMTPTYTNLADYREYMVNHEVGHFLGRGHVGCPKKGAPAPVMMQQSMSLGGCVTNPWPTTPD